MKTLTEVLAAPEEPQEVWCSLGDAVMTLTLRDGFARCNGWLDAQALRLVASRLDPQPGTDTSPQNQGGWVVANAERTLFRYWGDAVPEWTDDRDKALHFARRQDAEAFCRDDEDAWAILYSPLLANPDKAPA